MKGYQKHLAKVITLGLLLSSGGGNALRAGGRL